MILAYHEAMKELLVHLANMHSPNVTSAPFSLTVAGFPRPILYVLSSSRKSTDLPPFNNSSSQWPKPISTSLGHEEDSYIIHQVGNAGPRMSSVARSKTVVPAKSSNLAGRARPLT